MLISDLKVIVGNGGGIEIDGDRIPSTDLKVLASLAARSGATIYIRNAAKILPSDLKVIAGNGRGRVVFIF